MPEIVGDQAIAHTKAMLLAFGVNGPLRIQGLGRTGMMPKPENWQISLSSKAGQFEAYLYPNGRFWAIEKTPARHPLAKGTISAPDLRRANVWLTKISPQFPTRLSTSGWDASTAYFEAIVKGYPFVRRIYGYQFVFDRAGFIAYRAMETLPSLGQSVPKITAAEALRIGTQAFHQFNQPGRVSYGGFASTGLAWYEFQDQKRAVLVWRISGKPTILGGSWTKSPMEMELYIDAVTGALVPR